jgi:acetolactate synthase-1/2/3 large subunit
MIKVSDYLVQSLKEKTGIEHVFMLSGGMAMHLIESFGSTPGIKVIPMHHEQAAGIAANAYGRIRNIPGVCMVTAGPGATNAVTACAGAFLESSPMVFLSGQVSRRNGRGILGVRQRGIQEVDIVPVVKTITKYAAQVADPRSIRYHLEKALFHATTGRPGPVWLDVPVDVQGALVDAASMDGFTPSWTELDMGGVPATESILANVVGKLRQTRRPLLVLGQGVRLGGAAPLVGRLVDALGVPVQTTWNGMDLIGYDHPLYFGRANLFGQRYAIAMVDLDPAEMNKPGLRVTLPIRCDAGTFIRALVDRIPAGNPLTTPAEWLAYCARIKRKYPRHKPLDQIAHEPYVDPFYLVGALTECLPPDAVIPYGSSGMPHTVFGGNYYLRLGQRAFCFKGLAAMGYGLPSCVGAALAAPGKIVFTFIGDGGLQPNIQDLQTIKHHRLPVKIVVFNNGGYHSIHMTQNNFFGGHFVASGPESGVTFPPLEGVAALYGFRYLKVQRNTEVIANLKRLAADPEPTFLEVMIDPRKSLDPKLASYQKPDGTMDSRPLEDMSPLLSREELQSDMLIPIVS